MIEDELRSLLTERAGALPDNPARAVEIRSRIAGIRRRRIAGAALGLVLLAVAGLAVLRLPGTNESLPPGVPAPPWFDDLGRARPMPGFQIERAYLPVDGPTGVMHTSAANSYYEVLLLARCERSGDLTVRNRTNGSAEVVRCRIPVGNHHEGALLLPPERAKPLGEQGGGPAPENIVVEPGSAGAWHFAIASATLPTRLTTGVGQTLAEGPRTPRGTTVQVTVPVELPGPDVPKGYGFSVQAECVDGVELALSIHGAELGTISCRRDVDPAPPALHVPEARFKELGIRRGDRVPLTIRSVGRDTDQWRLFPPR